jgi:hypothetical protein
MTEASQIIFTRLSEITGEIYGENREQGSICGELSQGERTGQKAKVLGGKPKSWP